jgi:glucan 1,3-beta-glucosidase
MAPGESPRRPRERNHQRERRRTHGEKSRRPRATVSSSESGTQDLSAASLAKLDQHNRRTIREESTPTKPRKKRPREIIDEKVFIERTRKQHKKKRRVVSGALLEEGSSSKLKGLRGGDNYDKDSNDGKWNKKRICEFYYQPHQLQVNNGQ